MQAKFLAHVLAITSYRVAYVSHVHTDLVPGQVMYKRPSTLCSRPVFKTYLPWETEARTAQRQSAKHGVSRHRRPGQLKDMGAQSDIVAFANIEESRRAGQQNRTATNPSLRPVSMSTVSKQRARPLLST